MTRYLTLAEMDERRRVADALRAELNAASTERRQREGLVDDGRGGQEPGWVVYERNVMHNATNDLRHLRGLPPVPLDSIRRVETQAEGHVDYVRKFAWGCAELATPTEASR